MLEHRHREGEQLDALLRRRLDEIAVHIDRVREVTAGSAAIQREKLSARIREVAATADVDADRIEQEVVLLVQRADVDEELDRLEIHITEARSCLDGTGPHGRRLDFLIQELNREANTLASKAAVSECSQRAVDIKVLIEQMREQVQNIE